MLPSMWAKFQGAGMVLLWLPALLTNLAWVWFHPGAIHAFSPFSFFFRVLEFYLLHNGFPYVYCYLFIYYYLFGRSRQIYEHRSIVWHLEFFLKMNKYTTQLCTCFASYKWTCSLELKMQVSSCTGNPEFPGWSCWHSLIQFSVH